MSMPEKQETPPKRSRLAALERRRKRRWLLLGTLLLLASVGMIGGWRGLSSPASTVHRPLRVVIPPGANSLKIGDILQRAGIVRNGVVFALYARLHGQSNALRSGRYILSGDMDLDAILARLKRGSAQSANGIRVIIPEGFTLEQIADRFEAAGVCSGDELFRFATSSGKISQLRAGFPLPELSLEGYLFPSAYDFPLHTPPAQVLEEMLANFENRFVRPYQKEIEARGRDLPALVTEASLIEREAKVPEDRARIAGVIENRLQRGMRLEIDATVLYALGHHKDRVLNKDLRVVSPYNTYRRVGLPPGPIANPGLPSLLAALRPEQHAYLYYVARPNGASLFSRTLREHQKAIRQARRERHGLQRETGSLPGG